MSPLIRCARVINPELSRINNHFGWFHFSFSVVLLFSFVFCLLYIYCVFFSCYIVIEFREVSA
jgi:flagellar biosynthesis protein FlhB